MYTSAVTVSDDEQEEEKEEELNVNKSTHDRWYYYQAQGKHHQVLGGRKPLSDKSIYKLPVPHDSQSL